VVELDADVVSLLVRLGWLAESAVGEPQEIARAVAGVLADTAKRMREPTTPAGANRAYGARS
jgi:hypothetical protein